MGEVEIAEWLHRAQANGLHACCSTTFHSLSKTGNSHRAVYQEIRMKHKRPLDTPIMAEKCSTCPFREGSKTEFLREDLSVSALSEASRICHSTGKNNAFHRNTGKPERLCRGARDLQLQFFKSIGFIEDATDEAWQKKAKEMNLL